MDDASGPRPTRDAKGRFGPGNPGKPPGARNRIAGRIKLTLLQHFENNQEDILKMLLWARHFNDYMRLIGSMLPEDDEADGPDLPEPGEGGSGRAPGAPAALGSEPQSTVKYGADTVDCTGPDILERRSGWPGAI